jgi:MOSC domain-containing protein YiiM
MRIEQVNIGASRTLTSNRRSYETGIYKTAAAERVDVGELGLTGDTIIDGKWHGGVDQAVYLYSQEDYATLGEGLPEPFVPGTFGENLTTSGLDLAGLCVGDQLVSDRLVLAVTAPRVPCNTLEARVGIKGFSKRFMQIGRSGAYCRVLKTGSVGAGDEFELQPFAGDRVPLPTFLADMKRKLSADELQCYLALPIDERNRRDFERQLKALSR